MSGFFTTPVDIYCERLDPSFWAEPVNALTNLSFILAALAAYGLAQLQGVGRCIDVRVLCTLVGIIGIGSFLFHTLATPFGSVLDVVPIALYQVSFLALYARYVAGVSAGRVIMLIVGFFAAGHTASQFPAHWLNGSLSYLPALLFLFGFAIYHRMAGKVRRNALLAACAVFTLSLAFRSGDMKLCEAAPLGTHFMWHILNGVVLFMTTRAYILNHPKVRVPPQGLR